ncbi:hypothetical protein LR48_Vigan03g179900 [Vigna angularis]|uniref:DCD domain-containing protein n=1 Tax=Phaseolus angularis TaxID=3914 RepID=A0A0L9U6W4_PHAAN|nr:hypothetical protein LR48_Vigan03g179900 [Vigna angularis]
MENMQSFWQLGDELRGHSKASEDHKWLMVASKLAEQTRLKGERVNNLDLSKGPIETRSRDKFGFQEENKFDSLNLSMLNLDSKFTENVSKSSLRNSVYSMNAVYQKNNANLVSNVNSNKYSGNIQHNKESNNNSGNSNNNESNNSNSTDKRFKTLPAAETLPRNEAASFGGSNIDPTAWEDKKCKGESRFPAQVRIRVRKLCKALEEDSFRPVLHHYDGPKFRLELSVPETLDLLDLCEQAGSAA